MTLDPLGGARLPGPDGGAGIPAAGEILSAEVIESLGNRRYRVVIDGRLLEAVSSVPLGLGEEVLARVRHAGPPVLLELLADDRAGAPGGREGGYAVVRGTPEGNPGAAAPSPLAAPLARLVEVLPEPQRELLARLLRPGAAGAPVVPRQVVEGLARSLLAADPELRRIDGWIAALDGRFPAREAAAPEALAAALAEAMDALPPVEREALARAFPAGAGDAVVADLRAVLARLPEGALAAHPAVARLADLARAAGEEAVPAPAASATPEEAARLAADPDLPASREWLAGLPAARGARLRMFLAAREDGMITERPWSAPLREVARILDSGAQPGPGEMLPFSGASGHGVLRVYARGQEGGKKGPRDGREPARVGILLEMSRLGPVGAVVTGSPDGRTLAVALSADRNEARASLRAGLGELKSALEAAGWRAPSLSVWQPERRPAEAVFGDPADREGSIDVVA